MLKLLESLLNIKIWEWIAKNKSTFVLVILLLGNVYQYYDGSQMRNKYNKSLEEVNSKLIEANKGSLNYERERSNTLESLLHDLVIKYNNAIDSSNNNKKK